MKSRSFNLLKPLEPPKTVWDKIYDWLLGRARIVILITEILIAIAFFAKVIQDTDAKNKENTIAQLTSELSFYSGNLEPRYRTLITKNDTYQNLWNNSTSYSYLISQVYSYISNSASKINIRIDEKEITIFGTEDLKILQNLEAQLKSSPLFSSVVIKNLSLEQQEILEQRGDYVLSAVIKDLYRKSL